jgi:glycosyltransferase involved in cell wall biosynthesis
MDNGPSSKVSIIMPTYNRAEYIIETIESIRNQTYSNWELIIVDDGSDDNTEELILQIEDERIRFYKAGRIGVNGRIKNIGLEKASGELVAFIDSDDLWAPTKLEKQVTALQQYPEAGFSLTGGYNFRKLNEPVDFFYKQSEGIKCDSVFVSFFKSELSTTTPSLMLRRECINVAASFKETSSFSDIDFILSLAYHFKAVILYEPLLYRRLHNANDSNANWLKGYNKGIEIIQSYKKDLPAKIARDALFRLYINFGEDCLLYKERKKAIQHFLSAWKNKPYSIVPLKKTGKAIMQSFKK